MNKKKEKRYIQEVIGEPLDSFIDSLYEMAAGLENVTVTLGLLTYSYDDYESYSELYIEGERELTEQEKAAIAAKRSKAAEAAARRKLKDRERDLKEFNRLKSKLGL